MDAEIIPEFSRMWENYFPGEPFPVTFEISPDRRGMEEPLPSGTQRCFVCDLTKVRNGTDLAFSESTISCRGGLRYCGYVQEPFPYFRFFLSYGLEGKVEGERYKKSPELVDAWQQEIQVIPSSGKFLIFKRWDHLIPDDNPEVVIFFSRPEVLSGLFSLANYDRADPYGVITPMGAGCSSIVHYPYVEQQSGDPRAVMGMMDPSARPCVPVDVMTFAVPMKKFIPMIRNMEESFLRTHTWKKVQTKIKMSRIRQ